MDYREIENRMARSRDLIKERQYDRLIAEANKANKRQRRNWLAGLRSLFVSFKVRKPQPQPHVQLKPRHQFEPR